jgi:hypothetical protein
MPAIAIYEVPLLLEEGIKGWYADHPPPLLNQEGTTICGIWFVVGRARKTV